VFEMFQPHVDDPGRAGIAVTAFKNRKGFFSLLAQAFVDTILRHFSLLFPGGTYILDATFQDATRYF
jgi:hypothetical protein